MVYGMPRAAKNLGAVGFQLPLSKIPQKLLDLCETSESGVRAL